MREVKFAIRGRVVQNDDAAIAAIAVEPHENQGDGYYPPGSFINKKIGWNAGMVWPEPYEGTAKRRPSDEPNAAIGCDLALLRAVRKLETDLTRHINRAVPGEELGGLEREELEANLDSAYKINSHLAAANQNWSQAYDDQSSAPWSSLSWGGRMAESTEQGSC